MSFNNKSRLDPNQVEDRRGRGRGRTIAVGGGGLTLVIVVVAMLFGVDLTSLTGGQQAPYSNESVGEVYDLEAECQTGADANERQDCRIVGFVNSIQSFWTDEFARRGSQLHTSRYSSFHGVNRGRLWICQRRNGTILLSGRPESLSGPRLLQ